MSKPTEHQMRTLVEVIRKGQSGDSAYQHLLDTIALDLYEQFPDSFHIAEFVRNWKPTSSEDPTSIDRTRGE